VVRRIQGQPIALILLASALPGADVPEPRALLQRMYEAERNNRRQATRFVYREDIRHLETLPDGSTRRKNWITYEVTILEGEPYHRRVALNGQPLPPAEAQLEESRYQKVAAYRRATSFEERRQHHFAAEENRFKFDTRLVVDNHDLKLLGDAPLLGRDTWVLEATPRRGTRKPKTRAEWSLSQKLRYWVDKQTAVPLQVEAVQLYDYDTSRKGTTTLVVYTEVEGVWLTERIDSRGIRKIGRDKVITETDQRYSNYRRFRADSTLLFEDEPPRNP